MRIFLTGGSSGIGLATYDLLRNVHDVYAPRSDEFSLGDFSKIDSYDFSEYDVIINCAARNKGTHQGLFENSWQNQVEQINVNYTGALILAKRYLQCRESGQLVFVTSTSIDIPKAYNIFMASSKAALRFSLDVLRKEYPAFRITEVAPDKTKTNMLFQNYEDRKTKDEIEDEYNKTATLSAMEVASCIRLSLEHPIDKITISPHTLK